MPARGGATAMPSDTPRPVVQGLDGQRGGNLNIQAVDDLVPDGNFYSSAFEMKLSPDSYPGVSRYMHFKEANIALDGAMKSNSMLGELGINVPRSASGSITGSSPSGWVWHHSTNTGVMQLVPKVQHPSIPGGIFWETMHPGRIGGYSIWGK